MSKVLQEIYTFIDCVLYKNTDSIDQRMKENYYGQYLITDSLNSESLTDKKRGNYWISWLKTCLKGVMKIEWCCHKNSYVAPRKRIYQSVKFSECKWTGHTLKQEQCDTHVQKDQNRHLLLISQRFSQNELNTQCNMRY